MKWKNICYLIQNKVGRRHLECRHFGDAGVVTKTDVVTKTESVTKILTLKMMKTMIIGQNVSRQATSKLVTDVGDNFEILLTNSVCW